MGVSLEEKLGIIAVEEAVQAFRSKYPDSDFFKLQIEPEGSFLKYEMVGNNDAYKNTLELNAQTGSVIKEKQKPLSEKEIAKNPARRQEKALNLNDLKPLAEINQIALEQVGAGDAFQWELDREGQRTVWKIKFADAKGERNTEVKVDAQDGTIVQMKLKS